MTYALFEMIARVASAVPVLAKIIASAAIVLIVGTSVGCQKSAAPHPATPTLMPDAVLTRQDPSFVAFPGATAYFGELNGGVYRAEVPNNWNRQLVVYLRGTTLGAVLSAQPPELRAYLIRRGYAWATTSFDTNESITTSAADEAAGLIDFIVTITGPPQKTYLMGASMGGAGAIIGAERYGDRIDGALAYCGFAGNKTQYAADANAFVAGGYVAGITQDDLANSTARDLLDQRIIPALNNPDRRRLFDALWADLTGGARPFAAEGWEAIQRLLWPRVIFEVENGAIDNTNVRYDVGGVTGVASDAFNAMAVRFRGHTKSSDRLLSDQADVSGDLKVPVVTLHTTGDANIPLSHQQLLKSRVDAAGKSNLLVQRMVRDPDHCGFLNSEIEAAFESLVTWVETGVRPQGDDVSSNDLSGLGEQFTDAPRLGSPEASAVPGAAQRLIVTGTIDVDGSPYAGGAVDVVALDGGRMTPCQLDDTQVVGGEYRRTVAAEAEIAGCGGQGTEFALAIQLPDGRVVSSSNTFRRGATNELRFDVAIDTTRAQPLSIIAGDIVDSDGRDAGRGSMVEAYAGAVMCARTQVPRVGKRSSGYLLIFPPTSNGGSQDCAGDDFTYRIDGEPTMVISKLGLARDLALP